MKNFPVTERIKVQFRGDLFNILNHPNFGNPGNMGICNSISVPDGGSTSSCAGGPSSGVGNNTTFSTVGQTIAGEDNSLVGSGTARQIQLALKVIF